MLFVCAYKSTHSISVVLNATNHDVLHSGPINAYKIGTALIASILYWATLAINIPDFTRYSKSAKSMVIGQFIGLPVGMLLMTFIGIFVTGATVVVYGHPIWDPSELLGKNGIMDL